MLHEAGISYNQCRTTYVIHSEPFLGNPANFFPNQKQLKGGDAIYEGRYCTKEVQVGMMHLQKELALTKPKVIIPLGDIALWALTSEQSTFKWRGSLLQHKSGAWIIPTYHPRMILKIWAWRFIVVQDFRKALNQLTSPTYEPHYDFITRPLYEVASSLMISLIRRMEQGERLRLAVDIETRSQHIDCVGFAWSPTEALCIPFHTLKDGHYWSLEDEIDLLILLRRLLLHPNVEVIGQNFLYDASYFAKYWGWYPTPTFDTLVAQGVAFPGMQKSLDFMSSLYLPWHRYWKDESKIADTKVDDDMRWVYNCKDCCITWELVAPLTQSLEKENLTKPFQFEMSLFNPLMQMMMRGVRVNEALRSEYSLTLLDHIAAYEQWFADLGKGVWETSELVASKNASP
jgi:hypothetical protein